MGVLLAVRFHVLLLFVSFYAHWLLVFVFWFPCLFSGSCLSAFGFAFRCFFVVFRLSFRFVFCPSAFFSFRICFLVAIWVFGFPFFAEVFFVSLFWFFWFLFVGFCLSLSGLLLLSLFPFSFVALSCFLGVLVFGASFLVRFRFFALLCFLLCPLVFGLCVCFCFGLFLWFLTFGFWVRLYVRSLLHFFMVVVLAFRRCHLCFSRLCFLL